MKIQHLLKFSAIFLLLAVCLPSYAKTAGKTKKPEKTKAPVVYNFVEFLGAQKSIELKIKLAAWFRTWNEYIPDLALKDFKGTAMDKKHRGKLEPFDPNESLKDAEIDALKTKYFRRYNASGRQYGEFVECPSLDRNNGKVTLEYACDDSSDIAFFDLDKRTSVYLINSGSQTGFDEIFWLDNEKMIVCASTSDYITSQPENIEIKVEYPLIYFYNLKTDTVFEFTCPKYTHDTDKFSRNMLKRKRIDGYADMVKDGVVLSKGYLGMYR